MSRMMVYRGPQLVQLVKAYPNRRLPGSVQSARHAAQVAMSGEISANLPVSATLGRMRNSRSPVGGREVTARSWIQASGGCSVPNASRKAAIAAGAPSTSAIRPEESFRRSEEHTSELQSLR